MILAGGDVGIRSLVIICQRVLDGKGMTEDWASSVVFPILKVKEISWGVRLLEHAKTL